MAPRGVSAAEALAQQARTLELQGKFFWSQPAPGIFWVQLAGFHHYITGLRDLKGDATLVLAADEIEVQRAAQRQSHLWRYDASCDCVRDEGNEIDATLQTWRRRLRDMDLTAAFSLSDNGVVSWSFGPYERGGYAVINGGIFGKLPVARDGGIRTGLREFEVIVRFDSPEGWTTYSAPIAVDFSQSSETKWSRSSPPTARDDLP